MKDKLLNSYVYYRAHQIFYDFKEYHIFSKALTFIIIVLLNTIPDGFIEARKYTFFIFLLLVLLIIDLFIINYSDKQKLKNKNRRESFAGYILATYKSLDCYNSNFEKEALPGHLNILENWKIGIQQFRYPEDEEIFKKFVEFAERNELPTNSGSDWRKYNNYEKCAYLFLLNALISSYCFSDCLQPIDGYNKELYFKLIKLCHLPELEEYEKTFCSRETRKKIREIMYTKI